MHHYRLLKLKGLNVSLVLNHLYFWLWLFIKMVMWKRTRDQGRKTMTSDTVSSASSAVLHGNFSLVHYNVQSVVNKIDIIEPELSNFSLISLSETWLNNTVSNEDVQFNNFQVPFRRDREGDSHGGILVYIKMIFHANVDRILNW